jgi:hypothetical protein
MMVDPDGYYGIGFDSRGSHPSLNILRGSRRALPLYNNFFLLCYHKRFSVSFTPLVYQEETVAEEVFPLLPAKDLPW